MKKFMSTVALTLVAAVVLSLFSFPVFANTTNADGYLLNITFSEDSYALGESVVEKNGWTVSEEMRETDSAVVVADPDDATNRVLKITAPEKGSDAVRIYKLAVQDQPNTGKLYVSYRVKLKPYEKTVTTEPEEGSEGTGSTEVTEERAAWAWNDHFGSLDISNSDGTLVEEGTARFRFDGNSKSADTNTTMAYYAYKADGTSYKVNSSTGKATYVKAVNGSSTTAVGKSSLYNSWANVEEYINFDTNEYYFTITYTDMTGEEIKMTYLSDGNYGYSPLYFDGTTAETIGAFDKMDYINFAVAPKSGTGILYVDDIKVGRFEELTAQLVSDTITPNEELAIQFSNAVDASTVSSADFSVKDANGADVACPVSVRTSGKTVYAKISHLGFDESYTLSVSNANIADVYGQKLSSALDYDFYTDNKIMEIVPVTSVTFDEAGYTVGESVVGINNWTKSSDVSDSDTAKVVTDPDDSTNKVLEIYATAKSDSSSIFKYSFDSDIPDDSALLRVSYRMKMPAKDSSAPYSWKYGAKLGTLNAVNLSTGDKFDLFSNSSFNKNASTLLSHYSSYNSETDKLSQQCPTYDISPEGGWINVVEYIDFSTNMQKIELTKYYGETLGTKALWTTSYAGKPINTETLANKYDVVDAIFFGIDPQSGTGNATEAKLYVDDIEISRVPKYYIVDVDTELSGTTLNMSAKVGRPGYTEAETNSLIFAVMDANTKQLVKAIVKPIDYKSSHTTYIKKNTDTFTSGTKTTSLIEMDYTATAEDISGNVYVKAFLWKDIDTAIPYAVTATK